MTSKFHNCPAPAKLNLFLHVTGRRSDGYHFLQTAFQLIEYGDILHFDIRNDSLIKRNTSLLDIPEASDLTVQAAQLLHAITEKKFNRYVPGIDIQIEKKIPLGGGLGGGSSDAATTLIVLNHLWKAGLSKKELMAIGLQLGADIPFFIFGENAFAEGIGEQLQSVHTAQNWFVVIEPGVMAKTALIFNHPKLTRNTKSVTMSDFSEVLGSTDQLFGKNDLQDVVTQLFPPVKEAIEWMKRYGDARMTGSGACVFCGFSEETQANEVLKNVPTKWKAWKTKAIEQHPLSYLLPTDLE